MPPLLLKYLVLTYVASWLQSKKRTDSFLKRNKVSYINRYQSINCSLAIFDPCFTLFSLQQDISVTGSGSIERQDVKEQGKNDEAPRSIQDKVGIKEQSGILEPKKKKICDIPSQLYAAPQLDILFVPFDEKLATCIASRGLDPCPRMALKHSKKVTDIVLELTNIWKTALEAMGPGGIRLKAPDNSPVAFQAFSWGDPNRDAGISVRFKL